MRLIKLAIISIIFLFVVITGISLFIPSHVRISRPIVLGVDKDSLMVMIKDPEKWKQWYPGLDTAKPYYENGLVKGLVANDQDPNKPVYIHLTSVTSDEVQAEFVTKKLKPVVNGWQTITYPNRDSVTLVWYMDFHLRWYPWEKFSSLLLENSYGAKIERGLVNLKRIVEK